MKYIYLIYCITFIFSVTNCTKTKKTKFSFEEQKKRTNDSVAVEKFILQDLKGELKKPFGQVLDSVFKNKKNEDIRWFLTGKRLVMQTKLDSAKILMQKTIATYSDSNDLVTAKFHNMLGIIFIYQKNLTAAVYEFNKTIGIYESNGLRTYTGMAYNNLANVFLILNDYISAEKYSAKSNKIFTEIKDTVYRPGTVSVYAICLIQNKKFKEAEKYIREGIKLSTRYKSAIGLMTANHSLGEWNMDKGDSEAAFTAFNKSLALAEKANNSNFILLNNVALIDLNNRRNKPQEAIKNGILALDLAVKSQNISSLSTVHRDLGIAYRSIKDYEKADFHTKESLKIYRETAQIDNKKTLNDLLVKYDTVKKERALALKQKQVSSRNFWILLLASIVGILAILYFYTKRLNKQKIIAHERSRAQELTQAMLIGEEKEKERVSMELHDSVASSIAGIKLKLENSNSQIQSNELSNIVVNLQKLHEETRKISHNLLPFSAEHSDLIETIKNYCLENSDSNLKINLSANTANYKSINPLKAKTIYRITQELIHNVRKHAKSANCFVNFNLSEQLLQFSVEDEGIGFDTNIQKMSQGISSILTRIKNLDGTIEIDSKIAQGTLIMIEIPNTFS